MEEGWEGGSLYIPCGVGHGTRIGIKLNESGVGRGYRKGNKNRRTGSAEETHMRDTGYLKSDKSIFILLGSEGLGWNMSFFLLVCIEHHPSNVEGQGWTGQRGNGKN